MIGDVIRPTRDVNLGFGESQPITTGFLLRDLAFDFLHFAALPAKDAGSIELGLSTSNVRMTLSVSMRMQPLS